MNLLLFAFIILIVVSPPAIIYQAVSLLIVYRLPYSPTRLFLETTGGKMLTFTCSTLIGAAGEYCFLIWAFGAG